MDIEAFRNPHKTTHPRYVTDEEMKQFYRDVFAVEKAAAEAAGWLHVQMILNPTSEHTVKFIAEMSEKGWDAFVGKEDDEDDDEDDEDDDEDDESESTSVILEQWTPKMDLADKHIIFDFFPKSATADDIVASYAYMEDKKWKIVYHRKRYVAPPQPESHKQARVEFLTTGYMCAGCNGILAAAGVDGMCTKCWRECNPGKGDAAMLTAAMDTMTLANKAAERYTYDTLALKAMAKVYTDYDGDMLRISRALTVTFKDGVSFKDADDFAKLFLSGYVVKD